MLKQTAALDLKCNVESIVASDHMYIGTVRGCGREAAYIWQPDRTWLAPFDRAAIELACPRDELSAKVLSHSSISVSGCGKNAIYIAGVNREWILNSEVKP
jgi:hypothetical protein